jgi:NSS family neurotransmitter:Na+ symporter
MLCVVLILSYYSVVAGWVLKYAASACTGSLGAIDDTASYFVAFSTGAWAPLVYALCFLLMTHVIVERGVQNGIERFSKLLMPLLLVIMVLLAFGALSMPGAAAGVEFLLRPDFSKIDHTVVLSALGQAFFSLSIAIGCLSTYASYFRPSVPLMKTAANVVGIDTMVAILSGFIIFPAVFSVAGVETNAGPGLVFITLPSVFRSLFSGAPLLGYVFSLLFYVLLVLAALTSTISMHEEVTAFVVERWRLSRRRAAACMTGISMLLGALCCLSFGPLADFQPFFGMTFFDAFDQLTAQWIMPLSGIVLSLFVGWRLPRQLVVEELTNNGALRLPVWLIHTFFFLIRWLAPIAILLIFLFQ